MLKIDMGLIINIISACELQYLDSVTLYTSVKWGVVELKKSVVFRDTRVGKVLKAKTRKS